MARMPDGWRTARDKQSGRIFYIDTVSKTTQWTHPMNEGFQSGTQVRFFLPHTQTFLRKNKNDDCWADGKGGKWCLLTVERGSGVDHHFKLTEDLDVMGKYLRISEDGVADFKGQGGRGCRFRVKNHPSGHVSIHGFHGILGFNEDGAQDIGREVTRNRKFFAKGPNRNQDDEKKEESMSQMLSGGSVIRFKVKHHDGERGFLRSNGEVTDCKGKGGEQCRFEVHRLHGGKVRLQNEKTEKFLRVFKGEVDCDGGLGAYTEMRIIRKGDGTVQIRAVKEEKRIGFEKDLSWKGETGDGDCGRFEVSFAKRKKRGSFSRPRLQDGSIVCLDFGDGHLKRKLDGDVDGKGGMGRQASWMVDFTRGKGYTFQSIHAWENEKRYLRIDEDGQVDAQGQGGKFCFFRFERAGDGQMALKAKHNNMYIACSEGRVYAEDSKNEACRITSKKSKQEVARDWNWEE